MEAEEKLTSYGDVKTAECVKAIDCLLIFQRESSVSTLTNVCQKMAHQKDIESFPSAYTIDMIGKPAKLLEFECRGCEFRDFKPNVRC